MRQAEMEIISALVLDGGKIEDIRNSLRPEMFGERLLGVIYAEYWSSKEPLAYTDVMQKVIASGEKEGEVKDEIARCIKLPLTAATLKQNANVVREDWRMRQMKSILTNVSGNTVDDSIRGVMGQLGEMIKDTPRKEKSIAQITRESEGEYFKPNNKPKYNLGFEKLDESIGGIEGGDVVLIAARPAVGKSAFALQTMKQMAEEGLKIAYYNLEMRERQIYERFLASESGLALNRIRLGTGFLNDEEQRFRRGNESLKRYDNITVYSGTFGVQDIKGEGYDVIVIDYLQLLKPDGKRGGNRYAEVGDISRGIKAIAQDNNIPVIALSQLNRVSESTKDKEPMMADLRESGDLEQDASVIIILWNDKDDKSKKMMKVEKARHGTTERMELYFDGKHMRFEEWTDAEKTPFD